MDPYAAMRLGSFLKRTARESPHQSRLTYIYLSPFEQNNILGVARVREHVHRLHFHDAPTALGKKRRVARLRLRVTRNVDDTLGRKLARSFQEFRRGTRTEADPS